MENQILSEIQDKQDSNYAVLANSIREVQKSIDINQLYKKIYKLENKEQKDIYLELVQTFVETMNSRMDGARSGA